MAVGAVYGLAYPFFTNMIGIRNTEHITTVLPISIFIGAASGLLVGLLWRLFRYSANPEQEPNHQAS